MKFLPKILIIAGSDPSGGAGLQTDIKTATNHKVYASATPTALTSQNTAKVSGIFNPGPEILKSQLTALFTDIKYDVIKIGMVGDTKNIQVIIDSLDKFAKNIPVILDPVMVSTSDDKLFDVKDLESLKKLMKKATIATPNIDEAEILSGQNIKSEADIVKAAQKIQENSGNSVFIKSGHFDTKNSKITNIFLDKDGKVYKISNKRVKTKEIHGTGCALATAIACNIAKGKSTIFSVKKANSYIYKQIKKSQKVGKGSRILTHF